MQSLAQLRCTAMFEIPDGYFPESNPGFFSRLGTGTKNVFTQRLPNFLGNTVPNFINESPAKFNNWANNFSDAFDLSDPQSGWNRTNAYVARNVFNLQPKAERASWYSPRYENIPYEGPRFGEQGYFSQLGKDLASESVTALALAGGPPGGATAFALRSAARPAAQALRTSGSYLFNRGMPADFIKTGIETGEWAPAAGELGAWSGAIGASRGAQMLPWVLGGGKKRALFSMLAAGGLGGYGGYAAVRPFQDKLGGSVDALPFIDGRRMGSSDFVMRNGEFVYDPPFGRYPDYDRYMGRTE